MKIFDNFDLQKFLEFVQNHCDSGLHCFSAKMRYCKAILRAGYRELASDYYVILRSYSHDTIALECDGDGRVIWAAFYPYRSATTWQHVHKFCALFKNGRDLYRAYAEAAHGGKKVISLNEVKK